MTDPRTRAAIALDPGLVVRPRATLDADQPDAVRHWIALREAGLIGPPSAPTPPAIRANLDATDALFRRIAADRRRTG